MVNQTKTKLDVLKESLDLQGLSSDQWNNWLTQASETLWAVRQVLKEFEPSARQTFTELYEAEEYLICLIGELEG